MQAWKGTVYYQSFCILCHPLTQLSTLSNLFHHCHMCSWAAHPVVGSECAEWNLVWNEMVQHCTESHSICKALSKVFNAHILVLYVWRVCVLHVWRVCVLYVWRVCVLYVWREKNRIGCHLKEHTKGPVVRVWKCARRGTSFNMMWSAIYILDRFYISSAHMCNYTIIHGFIFWSKIPSLWLTVNNGGRERGREGGRGRRYQS